jgi:hypothetical protein
MNLIINNALRRLPAGIIQAEGDQLNRPHRYSFRGGEAMTHRKRFQMCAAIAAAVAILVTTRGQNVSAAEKLVVHEWGTFTSLQDENGRQLGGINVDDEPVPPFVYGFKFGRPSRLYPQHATAPGIISKGAPERHPFVTMRLETPVIYFYPPKTQSGPLTLNVDVHFLGGWLTQFYPSADCDAPGFKDNSTSLPTLDRNTVGRLAWNGLRVGTHAKGPATDEPVWLTPRNVAAAGVTTANGESEKYLFYRGVGNIDSPLAVAADSSTGTISLRPSIADGSLLGQSQSVRWLWLVHVRADGLTAYRELKPIELTANQKSIAATADGNFNNSDYARENLEKLQRSMHAALMKDGLFDEEATAMLQTWQKSYFATGGLRLFYIVPHAWTDHCLPLTISQPAEITRVMVARTELISPEQRELLKRLASEPNSDPKWVQNLNRENPAVQRFYEGHSGFGDLGVPIPPDYQLYLDLGRFRNALVLYQQKLHGSPSLRSFIDNYDLQQFQVFPDRSTR